MEQQRVSFWRRAVSGLIDASICLAVLLVWGMAWLYSQIGLCDCATAASLEDYVYAGTSTIQSADPSLALLPFALYAIWSWSPLSGRRSIGMRAVGIRIVRA